MRKVHIDGKEYKYKIGKGHIVIITPEGRRVNTNLSAVSGWNWNDIERGKWKGYFSIYPSMIKEWIVKNVVNST